MPYAAKGRRKTIEMTDVMDTTTPIEPSRTRLPLSARPLGEILVITAGIEQEKIDEALAAVPRWVERIARG